MNCLSYETQLELIRCFHGCLQTKEISRDSIGRKGQRTMLCYHRPCLKLSLDGNKGLFNSTTFDSRRINPFIPASIKPYVVDVELAIVNLFD